MKESDGNGERKRRRAYVYWMYVLPSSSDKLMKLQ